MILKLRGSKPNGMFVIIGLSAWTNDVSRAKTHDGNYLIGTLPPRLFSISAAAMLCHVLYEAILEFKLLV